MWYKIIGKLSLLAWNVATITQYWLVFQQLGASESFKMAVRTDVKHLLENDFNGSLGTNPSDWLFFFYEV